MTPHPRMAARESAARRWPALVGWIAWEERFGQEVRAHGRQAAALYEFLRFGIKQAWACLFGALVLALLIGTRLIWPHHAPIARYDALVIGCLAIQGGMLAFGLETFAEFRLILVFHVVGTAMEIFKTATGSWIYPEPGVLRLGGVPLFSGFMYGAVGSYLARVWRLFALRFDRHPGRGSLIVLSIAIYANFFADHWGWDARPVLLMATVLLFRRTMVYFMVWRVWRRMPLLLGFALVALFIWLAENIGTLSGTWLYPGQVHGWRMVGPAKLSAWFLLMLISYTLVAIDAQPRQIAVRADSLGNDRARRARASLP